MNEELLLFYTTAFFCGLFEAFFFFKIVYSAKRFRENKLFQYSCKITGRCIFFLHSPVFEGKLPQNNYKIGWFLSYLLGML